MRRLPSAHQPAKLKASTRVGGGEDRLCPETLLELAHAFRMELDMLVAQPAEIALAAVLWPRPAALIAVVW